MIGVLALQGAFAKHCAVLEALGVEAGEVRTLEQLQRCDALVLPGGESTTMSMLLERLELFDPVAERLQAGMPVLGTCAGMILLASAVTDGRADQRRFAAIDVSVRRNGYGRQIDSFEADIDVDGLDEPFHAVFIRAPVVESHGDSVDVLASIDSQPVLLRSDNVVVASFHPELTDDTRIHELFLTTAGVDTSG